VDLLWSQSIVINEKCDLILIISQRSRVTEGDDIYNKNQDGAISSRKNDGKNMHKYALYRVEWLGLNNYQQKKVSLIWSMLASSE
jgi:hypothetical protein